MARIRVENGRFVTEGFAPSVTEDLDERRRQAEERGFVQLPNGQVVITAGRRIA